MKVVRVTFVPNVLFDEYLPYLSESELKVLLVIIRQTNGWQRRDGRGRKSRDWIATAQFRAKTGLSQKSVSKAVCSLCERYMVVVSDISGNSLYTPSERRGHVRLFYSIGPRLKQEQKGARAGRVVRVGDLIKKWNR